MYTECSNGGREEEEEEGRNHTRCHSMKEDDNARKLINSLTKMEGNDVCADCGDKSESARYLAPIRRHPLAVGRKIFLTIISLHL